MVDSDRASITYRLWSHVGNAKYETSSAFTREQFHAIQLHIVPRVYRNNMHQITDATIDKLYE